MDEQTVEEYFKSFGDILACNILRNKKTSLSVMLAALMVDSSTWEAIEKFKNHYLLGCKLSVARINRQRNIIGNIPSRALLIIQGLHPISSKNSIHRYFGQFGKIERLLMAVNPKTGLNVGACRVVFEDDDESILRVIEASNFKGLELDGKEIYAIEVRNTN